MKVPNGEKWHHVYGDCAACAGTGVVEFDDLVEVLMSDWKALQIRLRAERKKEEEEWMDEEENRKSAQEQVRKEWDEKHVLLVIEQRRINRERAEAEWRERWLRTMELYGVPAVRMGELKFPNWPAATTPEP